MKKLSFLIVILVGMMVFAVACGGSGSSSTTASTASLGGSTSSSETTTSGAAGATSSSLPSGQTSISLSGDQVQPPVQTSASGTLALGISAQGITYELRVQGLTRADIVSAGIYLPQGAAVGPSSPGATGTTGGVTTTGGVPGNSTETTTGGASGTTGASTGSTGVSPGTSAGVGTPQLLIGDEIIDLLANNTSTTAAGGASSSSGATSSSGAGSTMAAGTGEVIASGVLGTQNLVGSAQGLTITQIMTQLLATGAPVIVQIDTKNHPNGELRGTVDIAKLAAEIPGSSVTSDDKGATSGTSGASSSSS